ncbi:general transcription factor II-I repeat domain-containing protein 2A-like [Pelodiscus sinensis]|uniref:general transcription factor II-I repeat domain-containing protein 2A-like n=1 Tax=Pelodiscus sinensis TaxID=13735 RepID=UPI003F6BE553
MQTQLKDDLEICDWFSLQFDVSTDISDTAQLAVMVRMVFSDFTIKEELLKVLPMKGRTKGEDIYNLFKSYATSISMPLHKLSAITTDGAPAMMGCTNGFIALCKKDESFPKCMSYHCIIHQEALRVKVLSFQHVMNVVIKIINSIQVKPLQHRLFKALLEDIDDKQSDLILHAEVRWLSKGKVLARFLSLVEEIKEFLKSTNQNFEQLEDSSWLMDLAFLADITDKLNILNLELQGKDKHVAQMIGSVKSFKAKLILWMSHMKTKSLVHFPSMKKMVCDSDFNPSPFVIHFQTLLQQFEKRFQQFTIIEPVVAFLVNPFTSQIEVTEMATSIASLVQVRTEEVELEILDLQNDIVLKSCATDENFWNLIDQKKFPALKNVAYKIKSYFGSTYLCEVLFSTMNFIKSKYRSRLTDVHLDDCL